MDVVLVERNESVVTFSKRINSFGVSCQAYVNFEQKFLQKKKEFCSQLEVGHLIALENAFNTSCLI